MGKTDFTYPLVLNYVAPSRSRACPGVPRAPPPPFLESDYYSQAPSPDAAIFFILGFEKIFWAIFLGRISNADRAAGPPLDVGERPHTPRGARL
jgi:hypothetical protein